MESFFTRFRNPLSLIVVLLAQTLGLAVQVRRPAASSRTSVVVQPDNRQVYLLRYWASAAAAPIERVTRGIGAGVRGTWSNYIDLRHTRSQNEELQRQIAELRLEQAAFAEDAIQGHRLQAMLDFQQQYVARTVAAQVLGTSGSDLSHLLTLDKGAAEGLKPDMAVITPDGVVGKLRDVFPHTSQLLLLSDPTAGAGVLLASTRIRAVVRGTPAGRLQISNLTADARIKPGEAILTSGGDLVFPRGLKVGTIESVAPDPDHQPYTAILLKPAANLAQLEEVLVITDTQTAIPPQARQDLAQGAVTAQKMTAERLAAEKAAADKQAADLQAANQRAADLLAERLPSLHDDTATDPNAPAADPDGSPAAKQPGGAIPKPLPTLHADRFTPGTTPSAAELTPGARALQSLPAREADPTATAQPIRKSRKPVPQNPEASPPEPTPKPATEPTQ